MSQSVGATTFTLFRSLPNELRNIIWVMSLPEDVQETCIFSRDKRWVREGEYPKVMMAFPWIAHVCRESRSEALRHIQILDFEDGPQWRTAYRPFRPEMDVMVLGPHAYRDENDSSSSSARKGDYTFHKDKWIMTERVRWARYFNVPMSADVPEGFPPLTLNVMRSIVAVGQLASKGQPLSSQSAQAAIIRALDAFFKAYWVNNQNIIDRDIITDILKATGADVVKVAELAGGEAKQILLKNTDQAFAEGAFGLPWFVCENDRGEKESFWGVDHLGVMLDFLGLEKPRAGGWKAML